ncbi:MAG: carboxypeptidase regulatory-like domain-containing protein [Acidobacteria bacterium]|nr:carboxypeptidase regulatory-like domain-containing protein [Acidobacteriota bacterium]
MSSPRKSAAVGGLLIRAVALAMCFSVLSQGVFAQFAKSDDKRSLPNVGESQKAPSGSDQLAPTPIQIEYGYSVCKEIFDRNDPRFPQVSNPAELIINAVPPFPGPASLITGTNPSREHFGYSLGDNPNLFISFNSVSSTSISGWNLSWVAPADVDRLVSIIAIRSNPSGLTNVYSYPNLAASDTGTFTAPGGGVIDQINICFEPFTGPSSAPVAISGRALTAEGTGIAGTRITVVDLGSGESHSAITNPFGYYTIEGLVAESTYMVSASHKRHSFVNNQRTITINEDLAGVDFVAP